MTLLKIFITFYNNKRIISELKNLMKKIQVYASPAGGGKSATMLIDAVRTKGQKIAFISMELRANLILKRISSIAKYFKIEDEDIDITVFNGALNPQYDLVGKLEGMKNKYDIIVVDGFDAYPTIVEGENLKITGYPLEDKVAFVNRVWFALFADKYFFKKETKCHSIWISTNTYRSVENNPASIKFSSSLSDKLEVKKISQKKYDEIKEISFVEAIDFDKRIIEQYNLSEIFKTL